MRLLLPLPMLLSCIAAACASPSSDVSELACNALESGVLFEVVYHGDKRLVEVHVVGETKDGIALIRVWQIEGPGDEPEGWRSFHPNEISDATVREEASNAPRPDCNPIDAAIVEVDCKV